MERWHKLDKFMRKLGDDIYWVYDMYMYSSPGRPESESDRKARMQIASDAKLKAAIEKRKRNESA